ncbi:MAG TPA: glycoside hydrolase family 2 TIM barrel-domain containing protein [Solirubrobacteraceae bacterium]|nr:glycoside hydrolase family 2 TIM barrel-domain containing protein [Solirubrobacteraceae bacterium]
MTVRSSSSAESLAVTRRTLLRAGAFGGATLAIGAATARAAKKPIPPPPAATATYDFNQGWRFGGVYRAGSQNPTYDDSSFSRVNLPHTVARLSWGEWEQASWQALWIYRKRFSAVTLLEGRVFVDFDGVMTNATVYMNGVELAEHLGGFLPFSVELTEFLVPGENDLGVVVDGRLLDVPPLGNQNGASSIDYLTPAGIYRDVRLRVVPDAYIADVFARPANVLGSRPALDLGITIDSTATLRDRAQLTVELLDGTRTVKTKVVKERIVRGTNAIAVNLTGLGGIHLWSPSSPKLYTVKVTLSSTVLPSHTVEVATGFRQATFEVDGFFLNGERLQIFGLNRHQLFPYTGMAAPARLQARDAQLLKAELNANMVRCSHYPQSPHFLDACDQLGLMVWEEPPGWQYIGDENFDAIFLQNVRDMVIRDRNRPSVIVWATRLDETASYPTLYAEARQLAYQLDGTRQTTGAMSTHQTTAWAEDVFADDDYGSSGGNAQLAPPIPGVPYMVSEAVGAITGPPLYRWIDSSQILQEQARLHAQVNQQARGNQAYAGVLGWCSIDYASLIGGARNWLNLRWPGVLDTFRVPKPGAAFYRSQISPLVAPVIIPAFYWDFGPSSPATGPGANAILFTNCEQLAYSVGGGALSVATPDTADYGNLAYPPVLVDLIASGASLPELLVYGYYQGNHVATLQMSSNTATDRLVLDLEDATITGDGSDATRLSFRALDAFGNQRPYVAGNVTLSLSGPAVLVGQNPFAFQTYGGVGGVFIRSEAGRSGTVTVTASHPTLGTARAKLTVVKATGLYL